MEKQIQILTKQNEGIETSLQSRGIKFTKLSIDLDLANNDIKLDLLKDYNTYLKNIVKENKPKPAPIPPPQPHVEYKYDDNEPEAKESKPLFSTITDMEEIKRAFFNKDYDTFEELMKAHEFKLYKANYKYASDNDGKASFIAKNLLRGFVQSLENYRKNFIVCFRCILVDFENNKYKYPSYWILNSNDELKVILGSQYDDFDFILVETEDAKKTMLTKMRKHIDDSDDALIGENYLH
jgi:hypothetical protein